MHKHGLVPGSFIPPLEIRQIRDLMRYRFKLINFKTSEINRVQNSLTVSNIMISSVVSDKFGVSSMNIIQHILDNPDDTNFDVSSMLHGSMKHKTKTIVKSIQGNLTEPQTDKMSVSLDHMESIEKHISDIESVVLKLVQPYLPQVELILSLPGIKDIFKAIAILGEIGVDMSVFHSQKHICSWTGLTPQNNESVGKKNPSVFHELVFISSLYWYNAQMLRLKVRIVLTSKCAMSKLKNVGVTKNRLLRLLIICIYQMLDKNEPFNDELYKIDIHPKPKRPYAPQITEDMAIRYLETFGYQIPDKRVIT